MITTLSRVEILMTRAIEIVEALGRVFDRVRVNDVEQYRDADTMRGVDEMFQIIGRPKARTWRKKRRNMITKRPVIRMLLHRHELHGVVSRGLDAWQDSVGKFTIPMHSQLFASHADMRFVNQWDFDRQRFMLPLIRRWRPQLAAVIICLSLLHRPANASGDAVTPRTIGADHMQLHALTVRQRIGRKLQFPNTTLPHL